MQLTVLHSLSMTTPDDSAYENKPSDWNKSHLVTASVVAADISGLFSNGNGVSFTTANGSLGASVATNYQSQGNYLTTARASNDAIGTNTALTANGVSITANSSGLSLNFPAFLTTAMGSNRGTDFVQATAAFNGTNASGTIASNGISISVAAPGGGGGAAISGGTNSQNTGTVNFSNSNGVSFGLNTNGVMTASVAAAGGAQTGISGIAVVGSTVTVGTVQFSNSNGVSFGLNGSTMTASVNTSYRASNDAIGTNTALTANGVSITANSSGLSLNFPAFLTTAMQSASSSNFAATGFTTTTAAGSVIAGTHDTAGLKLAVPAYLTTAQSPGAYLTTARASNDAIGLNTALTANGVSMTANSSGLSLNFPAFLTTAAQSGDTSKYVQNWKLTGNTAGTTSSAQGTDLWIAGGNGVTISGSSNTLSFSVATNYQSQGAYLTTAMASNRGSDFVAATAAFAGTNASGTIASNGISISVAAPGGAGTTNQTGPNIADANGHTITSGTVVFSNSNLISFGLNGSTMTASFGDPDNWALYGNTAGTSASTIGTGGLYFQGGNNITLSGSSNTIVISAGGAAAITQMSTQNRQLAASITTVQGINSNWIVPFRLNNYLNASTLMFPFIYSGTATSNQTNTFGQTIDFALYTAAESNQSAFNSLWSTQVTLAVWNSGTVSASTAYAGTTSSSGGTGILTQIYGLRYLTQAIGSTLSPGLYAFGIRASQSSAGQSSVMRSANFVIDNPMASGGGFLNGANTNASIGYVDGGTWSSNATQLPTSFNLTDVKQTMNAMPFVKIGAI